MPFAQYDGAMLDARFLLVAELLVSVPVITNHVFASYSSFKDLSILVSTFNTVRDFTQMLTSEYRTAFETC